MKATEDLSLQHCQQLGQKKREGKEEDDEKKEEEKIAIRNLSRWISKVHRQKKIKRRKREEKETFSFTSTEKVNDFSLFAGCSLVTSNWNDAKLFEKLEMG